MKTIQLTAIKKQDTSIKYEFTYTDDLKQYFSGHPFIVEYPENIESVPDSIAAIPFVGSVLLIVWLTHSKLILPALDKAFFDCLPDLKKGYETMFPESSFSGEIEVHEIIESPKFQGGPCAMFYSGGVDSMATLFRHKEEKPILLSIWGSDIKYNNKDGWNLVHCAIVEGAEMFGLQEAVFHSSFREFDNEDKLDQDFHAQLRDGWWHGVKHGIALLSHVAPYAYIHNISIMYIASSHSPEDGHVRCASNPLTDNQIRFVNCKVCHDGFELDRQRKLQFISEICHKTNEFLPLHVCWESQSGGNCCRCEKCYRTFIGLLAEGDDPALYGFSEWKKNVKQMPFFLVCEKNRYVEVFLSQWTHIQRRINENKKDIKDKKLWRYVSWVSKADFKHPENLKLTLKENVRFLPMRLYRKIRREVRKIIS